MTMLLSQKILSISIPPAMSVSVPLFWHFIRHFNLANFIRRTQCLIVIFIRKLLWNQCHRVWDKGRGRKFSCFLGNLGSHINSSPGAWIGFKGCLWPGRDRKEISLSIIWSRYHLILAVAMVTMATAPTAAEVVSKHQSPSYRLKPRKPPCGEGGVEE